MIYEKYKQLMNYPEARVVLRFLKTFLYTCLAFYATNKVAPFSVDWMAMVEVGILAGFGFGLDKGIREYKNVK